MMRSSTIKSFAALFEENLKKTNLEIYLFILYTLLCYPSHVGAMQRGRLMCPNKFIALSGDLHVQIQFNGQDLLNDSASTEDYKNSSIKPAKILPKPLQKQNNTELIYAHKKLEIKKVIMSSLVISRYIDESNANFNDKITAPEKDQIRDKTPFVHSKRKTIVQNIPIFPDPRHNVTQVLIPCQTFLNGGFYEIQVITNIKSTGLFHISSSNKSDSLTTTTLIPVKDERLKQMLDVRWPQAEMIVAPLHLRTYPESPVEVIVRYPEVDCDRAENEKNLPEFWIELLYCGKDKSCNQLSNQNISKSNTLYAEQIRGYPKYIKIDLKCNFFGLAGNYLVQLRPMVYSPRVPIIRRFLSVDWSDKFIFNVYARSIFPCDPHIGIGVLFEYPNCILDQGDRIRVYAKLRADVASLKPPTSLHYVAEQRVIKRQYSLYFNCDIFSEKYVEYCFVYVSQAISGAVADVRMNCIPTLPVRDSDTGNWGPWSEWTPCSTNCLGGTRNRYRFCDSPPPRYGAKFCEGPSVQTEICAKNDTLDCFYETTIINKTKVYQELDPDCLCGCIIHLNASNSKSIISGASQSCPGHSYWLIQVDDIKTISFILNVLLLSCSTQYIKVRDGPSLLSSLLFEINGDTNDNDLPKLIESNGGQILIEFFAGDDAADAFNGSSPKILNINYGVVPKTAVCSGGFIAYVEQLEPKSKNDSIPLLATHLSVNGRMLQKNFKTRSKFTIVHLAAVVFASIILFISALLGGQYIARYKSYHLALVHKRDGVSCLHTPQASINSLRNSPFRALSTMTLLSEVMYMIKIPPKHPKCHSELCESKDAEKPSSDNVARCGESEIEFVGSFDSIITIQNELFSPVTHKLCSSISQEADNSQQSIMTETFTHKIKPKVTGSFTPPNMENCKYSDCFDIPILKLENSKFNDSRSLHSGSSHLREFSVHSPESLFPNASFSPAASIVSTAAIRTTNLKESKDQQNRKKILTQLRSNSEFSLGNQQDLELDYYDYNVVNAGAAPGSYLGMDPAYLIWIPPFDEVLDKEACECTVAASKPMENNESLVDELNKPSNEQYLSPLNDFEAKICKENKDPSSISSIDINMKNSFIKKIIKAMGAGSSYYTAQQYQHKVESQYKSISLEKNKDTKSLDKLIGTKSGLEISCLVHSDLFEVKTPIKESYIEKETSVVKASSDLQSFLALDGIKFADEIESDDDKIKSMNFLN